MTHPNIADAQAAIERIAIIVAAYHDTLLRNNLPINEALYLARDLHDRYMDVIFPPLPIV